MRDANQEDFFSLLNRLDSALKPHIQLGPIRFALGNQGAEMIHDPNHETWLDDIRPSLSNKEAENLLREFAKHPQPEQTKGGFVLLSNRAKAIPKSLLPEVPAQDGSVIKAKQRSRSLLELACEELSPREIQRFIIKSSEGEITSIESKRFERKFLGIVRRTINRKLTELINDLPSPVRGSGKSESRQNEIKLVREKIEKCERGGMSKTQAVKEIATNRGYGSEATIWRYLRKGKTESGRAQDSKTKRIRSRL